MVGRCLSLRRGCAVGRHLGMALSMGMKRKGLTQSEPLQGYASSKAQVALKVASQNTWRLSASGIPPHIRAQQNTVRTWHWIRHLYCHNI